MQVNDSEMKVMDTEDEKVRSRPRNVQYDDHGEQ
jgi:hypothetical protein